ncbi:5'-nucleotidase domain-containing protein, partial [Rhodopirellula maiorica SM1]
MFDAGDLIGDTMIAQLTDGEALVRIFETLRYDAVVIGNHEPDFGGGTLAKRIDTAGFAVIAANVRRKDSGTLLTRPYIIKDFDGVKVGVIGLAYPKTPWTTAPKNVANFVFEDPADVARNAVKELRSQGVDLVIALTHLGLGADVELAKQVQGIDVIVGGHSHNRMHEARRVGETLIVQAGAHGSDLGRLDLVVENGKITEHRRNLYPLLATEFDQDSAVQQVVEDIHAPYRDVLDEPIGQADEWLIRAQTLAGQQPRKRDAQSPVDSLFADILRETTRSDVAFLPGVGYGVAIPPGKITAPQLRQLVPHEGKVVTMQLSGKQIRDILNQAVENVFTKDIDKKVGGMIQVSGLHFTYDPKRSSGNRIVEIQMQERPWRADRTYRVATNSMLVSGGHRQSTFSGGSQLQEHGSQYEMIKSYFQKQSGVSSPDDIRIRQVG